MDTHVIVAVVAALVLTAGGGLLTPIDGWYAALRKPSWNPPNWAFGPAWTIILGLWAWSGILAWRGASGADAQTAVLILYGVNAVCHFAWSPIFFKFRRPDYALIEVVFLWGSLLALLIAVRPFSVLASWLIVPYFAWVSFAACLNAAIVARNRPFG
ncbi:MAG: tryptophan-rich sensory protein [Sphingomonadaceae bacterium]|nr:tryptophan-rich sensory protein [Sphingomonadaceae bacterium]